LSDPMIEVNMGATYRRIMNPSFILFYGQQAMRGYRTLIFGVVMGVTLLPALSVAQTENAAQPGNVSIPARYSPAELDQLLAPMALYPDTVLSQVLIASTYPLEVVKAQRWLQQHPGLSGSALDSALANESWDGSVKAIAAFPSVVAMMNDNLDWTQRLGDAFLAQQADVMDTVQKLRQKAQSAGTLYSDNRQQIATQDGEIDIVPTNPDVVYVPVYDPTIVYGPWWWPGYPPFIWLPPPIYGPYAYIVTGFAFGLGIAVGHAYFHDVHPNWRGRQINVRPHRPPGTFAPGSVPPNRPSPWHHDPAHRVGVPYTTPNVRERYQPANPGAVTQRHEYRGFQGGVMPPAAPRPARPIAIPQAPRALSPLSPEPRGSVQGYSLRGHASLSPPPSPAPRPMAQPSAPSVRGGQGPAHGERRR
jgi:hypothetical protein